MTGIKILQSRVKHLNDISKRDFRLSSLGTGIGGNDTLYKFYTLRLLSPKGYAVIFHQTRARNALFIIESMIDFFLADRENNPLLYVFA